MIEDELGALDHLAMARKYQVAEENKQNEFYAILFDFIEGLAGHRLSYHLRPIHSKLRAQVVFFWDFSRDQDQQSLTADNFDSEFSTYLSPGIAASIEYVYTLLQTYGSVDICQLKLYELMNILKVRNHFRVLVLYYHENSPADLMQYRNISRAMTTNHNNRSFLSMKFMLEARDQSREAEFQDEQWQSGQRGARPARVQWTYDKRKIKHQRKVELEED